jgi:topoisomerase-4 subunit A
MNKDYFLVPDGAAVLHIDTRPKFSFILKYTPKPRLKVLMEEFKAHDYSVRGLKAGGIKLSNKEVSKLSTGQQEAGKKKNDE